MKYFTTGDALGFSGTGGLGFFSAMVEVIQIPY